MQNDLDTIQTKEKERTQRDLHDPRQEIKESSSTKKKRSNFISLTDTHLNRRFVFIIQLDIQKKR